MDTVQATSWLSQFIGKTLRIHASDGRVFGGQMKCTDKVSVHWYVGYCVLYANTNLIKDRNVILALAHEYRAPSAETIRKAVVDSGNSSASVAWSSRYVGLIVVPGHHIKKIEFEESALPGQKSGITL